MVDLFLVVENATSSNNTMSYDTKLKVDIMILKSDCLKESDKQSCACNYDPDAFVISENMKLRIFII